jgi:hypothetical protein
MSSLHQKRTHFALKAKRALGEWVPQTGPIEEADQILKKMRHQLINERAGIKHKPSPTQNMLHNLSTSRDPHRALRIYGLSAQPMDRRRMMTARRIMHRLGLLEERPDQEEIDRWSRNAFKKWKWVTQNHLMISPSLKLMAGTEVSYLGGGTFGYDDGENFLSAEQAREAGVRRYRKWR